MRTIRYPNMLTKTYKRTRGMVLGAKPLGGNFVGSKNDLDVGAKRPRVKREAKRLGGTTCRGEGFGNAAGGRGGGPSWGRNDLLPIRRRSYEYRK